MVFWGGNVHVGRSLICPLLCMTFSVSVACTKQPSKADPKFISASYVSSSTLDCTHETKASILSDDLRQTGFELLVISTYITLIGVGDNLEGGFNLEI